MLFSSRAALGGPLVQEWLQLNVHLVPYLVCHTLTWRKSPSMWESHLDHIPFGWEFNYQVCDTLVEVAPTSKWYLRSLYHPPSPPLPAYVKGFLIPRTCHPYYPLLRYCPIFLVVIQKIFCECVYQGRLYYSNNLNNLEGKREVHHFS